MKSSLPLRMVFMLLLFLLVSSLSAQKHEWKEATAGGYTYRYVTNDPMQTRFYTLKNGLQFIASVNKKEPRIQTLFAVRAGSNTDPSTNTGLAHYLEHLLFKGTDKFGSLDWAKEKPLLDQIEQLYEKYNKTTDENQRKEIYKEIDRVSGEAAKYAIANEYSKMIDGMGGLGSNAHTWYEETVYEGDIPTASIDKFLALQSERFRNPVLRMFHTELEAVYEEKNRVLDNDGRKSFYAALESLFPTHNYGLQTTIGTIEHLKNPSLKEIRKYYDTYYVPNNMALIFSGDFNPDEVVAKVDAAFSYMKPKAFDEYNPAPEAPMTASIEKHVYGPAAENVTISFRAPGAMDYRGSVLVTVVDELLVNGKAGLVDLNVNKQQRILNGSSTVARYKDYAIPQLIGAPKDGQTLEEVRDILLSQVELMKMGSFDESLIKAIANKYKLAEIQQLEQNFPRANDLMDSFIQTRGNDWNERVSLVENISKVTKKEVMDFVNQHYKYYVVVYKHKGQDKNLVKVDKPPITPVTINSNVQSDFARSINEMKVAPVSPQWLDYDKGIQKDKIGSADFLYVQNNDNDLFRLYYRFDMGSFNNKLLPLAANYLQYLGTDQYTADQISTELFQLASNFTMSSNGELTTVTLTGLKENLDKSITLLEHVLTNCKADVKAWSDLKQRMQKSRSNSKLSRPAISQSLYNYAQYGPTNPFNNVLTNEELDKVKPEDLVQLLHDLFKFKHTVIFYGPQTQKEMKAKVKQLHKIPAIFTTYPVATTFSIEKRERPQVLFVDYDMVQAEVYWVMNPHMYDPAYTPVIELYNRYFGSGMGSIVFQTIRESQALAYSTFGFMITPDRKDKPYFMIAYVGTQADKISQAISSMDGLLGELPHSEKIFLSSKDNLKKEIETERISQDGIIFSYLTAKRMGLNDDDRRVIYQSIDKMTFDDLKKFQHDWLEGKPFTYCVIASEKKVNPDDLKKYGDVKKVSLQELFGY